MWPALHDFEIFWLAYPMVDGIKECLCILVADAHTLGREALCLWLKRVLPDASVFEVASGGEEFACTPDCLNLILFALRQPYHTGFSMLQDLRSRFPITPVVLLSNVIDDGIVSMARAHGVSGLFQTSDSTRELLGAMRAALEGMPAASIELCAIAAHGGFKFSPRQMEVLRLLCRGKSNKEIAAELDLSSNTVRTHITAIFNILGVRNRTEAVISGRYLI